MSTNKKLNAPPNRGVPDPLDSAARCACRLAPIFAHQPAPSNGPVSIALDRTRETRCDCYHSLQPLLH